MKEERLSATQRLQQRTSLHNYKCTCRCRRNTSALKTEWVRRRCLCSVYNTTIHCSAVLLCCQQLQNVYYIFLIPHWECSVTVYDYPQCFCSAASHRIALDEIRSWDLQLAASRRTRVLLLVTVIGLTSAIAQIFQCYCQNCAIVQYNYTVKWSLKENHQQKKIGRDTQIAGACGTK